MAVLNPLIRLEKVSKRYEEAGRMRTILDEDLGVKADSGRLFPAMRTAVRSARFWPDLVEFRPVA